MIELKDLSKRYIVDRVPQKWVFKGVSLRIPAMATVGVLGAAGSGKTTLLRLITGAEQPTEGEVHRLGRISDPARYLRNLQPRLSGRQNARFICRVSGYADQLDERLARIEKLARLGPKFERPISGYDAGSKARLGFALSWALEFDFYVADVFNFAGDTAFADKEVARSELQQRAGSSGIIMVARGAEAEANLRRLCRSGIVLHDGQAQWFNRIEDAMDAFRATVPAKADKVQQKPTPALRAEAVVPGAFQPVAASIRRMQNLLTVLQRAVAGQPQSVPGNSVPSLVRAGRDMGLEIASREHLAQQGLLPLPDAVPLLQASMAGGRQVDYFDLKTQSVPMSVSTSLCRERQGQRE